MNIDSIMGGVDRLVAVLERLCEALECQNNNVNELLNDNPQEHVMHVIRGGEDENTEAD